MAKNNFATQKLRKCLMIMIIMMPMKIMKMKGYMTIMVFMTADLNRGRGQYYENAENRGRYFGNIEN